MDIITSNKVQLIDWLSGEDFILQHVQSRKLISRAEYDKIKSIQEPGAKITELLDTIMRKGNSTCVAFLLLLKEDSVTESRPELREFMKTVNPSALPEKKETSNTSQAGNGKIADNREFLRSNRGELIDNVKSVDRIVDDLKLTNEMVANVQAEKTDQAKMRKVLDYTNSKRAAQLLVDALYKYAADVMEDLTTP